MTDYRELPQPDYSALERRPTKRKLPLRATLIGAALLAAGIGGGTVIAQHAGPSVEMAPVSPQAIKSLTDDGGVVSVRGKVAETFGPMVVLADGTGRALVDLGRQGDGTGLVSAGQSVTVQGHFRHGMIRASFLVGADGKVVALHPMGPEHGGPGGEGFRHGPHEGRPDRPGAHGPDGGPDAAGAPPPPPAAAPAVTAKSAG
jgi:hypothetical protein